MIINFMAFAPCCHEKEHAVLYRNVQPLVSRRIASLEKDNREMAESWSKMIVTTVAKILWLVLFEPLFVQLFVSVTDYVKAEAF